MRFKKSRLYSLLLKNTVSQNNQGCLRDGMIIRIINEQRLQRLAMRLKCVVRR